VKLVAGCWLLVAVARNQLPETRNQRKSLREKICVRILRHDHNWHLSCAHVGE